MKETVTLELLRDSYEPSILAIAIDDKRITPNKHSGQWDSARVWKRIRVSELLAAVGADNTAIESTIAEQAERIAELKASLTSTVDEVFRWKDLCDAARAEVPEWIKDFAATVVRAWNDVGWSRNVQQIQGAIDRHSDQLRACGIEVP